VTEKAYCGSTSELPQDVKSNISRTSFSIDDRRMSCQPKLIKNADNLLIFNSLLEAISKLAVHLGRQKKKVPKVL
jgi:hypothetical protein